MSTPLFSLIVPVFNVEPFLKETLESVSSQTFNDWEAICVDDGSSDGSGKILDEYSIRDLRFRVFHQLNKGVSAARNLALKKIVGKYVVFLDGDDLIKDSTLETVAGWIAANKDVQIFSYKTFRFNQTKSLIWPMCQGENSPRIVDLTRSSDDPALFGHFAEKVYAREIIPERGFLPYAHGEDLLFLAEAGCRAKKLMVYDSTFYAYRCRTGSATENVLNERAFTDRLGCIPEFFRIFSQAGRKPSRKAVRDRMFIITYSYVSRLLRMPVEQRDKLWKMWFRLLSDTKAAGEGILNSMDRILIGFFLLPQSKCLAFVFLGLPAYCVRIVKALRVMLGL